MTVCHGRYRFAFEFICNKQTKILTWLFSKDMAILAGITAGAWPAHTGARTISEHSHAIALTWSAVTRALILQIGLQCPLEVEFLQPGTWHLFYQFKQWPQLGIRHHIMNASILTLYLFYYAHVFDVLILTYLLFYYFRVLLH